MEIKRAEVEDAADIHALEQAYIECPWSQSNILAALSDERYLFFKAVEDGVAVGYVSAETCLDEVDICNVAVHADYRRRGIAEKLVTAAVDAAKENGAVKAYLEVNVNNAAAIALYAKLGFTEAYVRKNYYGSESASVMLKNL